MAEDPWVVYEGKEGPGKGKHIVLMAGDDEYRSEELIPQLGRILAVHHGFKCTVLFPIGPDGTIDPGARNNIPGLAALDGADLCILMLRFRELPDAQMKHFADYVAAGKPIIGLRTSTHAFNYTANPGSPYARYDFRSRAWPGGFGKQVLGETWVGHHGLHGKESTRGIIDERRRGHPILRGVRDIWGPSDVYAVAGLPEDATVLVWGQVLSGMRPGDPPVAGAKNDPMMPLVWVRELPREGGGISRIVTATMGAAVDMENEGLRRLLVNACYWAVGLEDRIPPESDVQYAGDFRPSWFGFGTFRRGVRPADLEPK